MTKAIRPGQLWRQQYLNSGMTLVLVLPVAHGVYRRYHAVLVYDKLCDATVTKGEWRTYKRYWPGDVFDPYTLLSDTPI